MKNYTFNVSNMTLVYISDLYIPVWDTRKFFQFLMNPAVCIQYGIHQILLVTTYYVL